MKSKQIKLKKAEKGVIQPYIERMKEAEVLMEQGARLHKANHKKMWEALHASYPELDDATDVSFNFESAILSFSVTSAEVLECRKQKNKAIEVQDFEVAASWRDKEKAAIRKLK